MRGGWLVTSRAVFCYRRHGHRSRGGREGPRKTLRGEVVRPEEGGREAHVRGRGAAGIRGPTCAGHPRVWLCVYVFVRVRPERKGRMSMCLAEHVTSNQSCWRALL